MDYEEECCGLHNKKKTWTYISEEQYKHLKPAVGNALQKISIATIITDANSKPQRAKYRVCVIGNIDPTNWSLNKVFAPVLFQLKLRILTTIAVQKRSKFNTGDFKQAFCQEYLPDGETYVLRPPKYCPITTTPNMYLHIIQTLYGLKRSPRHWYEKAQATFLSIVLNNKIPHTSSESQSCLSIHPFMWASTLMNSYILVQARWLKNNLSNALGRIKKC